jgi:DNA-binding CsgD family transcriptional regulator
MKGHRYEAGFDAFLEPWSPVWSAAIAAAASASDPAPHVVPLISQLGFDALTCIALARSAGGGERTIAMWSTARCGWAERYRERGYASVDPRVTMTAARLAPIVWDAIDVGGDCAVQRFLDDAARFGVRSGCAVSFRHAAQLRIVVAFDRASSPLSEPDCIDLISRLGQLMVLAAALHDRVLRPRFGTLQRIERATASELTSREGACLQMAARGLTSADIGTKLGIAERTVNFHMRNVLRKLEAVNRVEAIAKALAGGVFEASALAQRSV